MSLLSRRNPGSISYALVWALAHACLVIVFSAAPLSAQKTARVEVRLNSELATVPAAGYGVGMSVYDNNFTSPGLPEKLKTAGVTALRFPGGSYSDAYHWKTHTGTPGTNIYINANDTFDNFMTKNLLPAGAQAILTVNYGSNAAGTGGSDPAEAADWVRYANKAKGWGVRYWEIGNEVGGNGYFSGSGWEEDLHYPYDGKRKGQPALSMAAYGKNSLEFIGAMKAVDPTIKIGVGLDMPDSNAPDGNAPLSKEVKDKIDFAIVHWYPKSSSTDLTVTEDIKPQVAALREQIAKYAGASQRNIPLAITETNGGGSGASRAIFATDTFLTWFECGAFTVEWQEMHNGFLSDVKEVPLNTPTEAYYGMQMASLAARPGDTLVAAQSNSPLLVAHAVKRSGGGVGLLLINKHPNQAFQIDVSIPNANLNPTGTRYDFGRANFNFDSPWPVSGPLKSQMKVVGSNFTLWVPPFSESAIVLSNK